MGEIIPIEFVGVNKMLTVCYKTDYPVITDDDHHIMAIARPDGLSVPFFTSFSSLSFHLIRRETIFTFT